MIGLAYHGNSTLPPNNQLERTRKPSAFLPDAVHRAALLNRSQHMIGIRQAKLRDSHRVRDLYLSAFPDVERQTVADIAVTLLTEQTTTKTFALVAETDDNLVGHVAFSPVTCIVTDKQLGYLLAPLAVHPACQKRGIGTDLVKTGIKHLSGLDVAIVFVYGDPNYYGRFGFDTDIAVGYAPPYQLQYEFGWQAKRLTTNNELPSSRTLTCVQSLMDSQLW